MTSMAEYRLRHAPTRELSDRELWEASARGWLASSLYRAECARREQLRRATDAKVRQAFAEAA
jgi:hypothetical protein